MSCGSEEQLKELFVKGIKDGLSEAFTDTYNKIGEFHNARNFDKIDFIMNSIVRALDKNENIKWLKLPRGLSYEVLLVFDHSNKHLYSFMSERRFKEIYFKANGSVHYIHGLVKFNEGYERKQIIIDDTMFNEQNNSKLQSLKSQIDDLLINMKPNKYFTVIYDMNEYNLLGVKCVLTSEYMEIISEEDWSELISIDYGDIHYDVSISEEDLGITLKTNYISDENDIENNITPKEEIKEEE